MPATASHRIIALTGFMGCGKTTVGRLFAERIGWRFVDLDTRIVESAHATIVEIFRRHGEPAFRELETEALDRALGEAIEGEHSIVLALGGGTLTRAENLARLRQAGSVLVWLDCPVEELLQRCAGVTDRPLFENEASFRRLHSERAAVYRQSDHRVDATPTPAQVVERILGLLHPSAVDA